MKRSATPTSITSDTQDSSEDFKPDVTPSPPGSTKSKTSPKKTSSPKKATTPKKAKTSGGSDTDVKKSNGVWTEEKRTKLMAMVLDAGYKQMSLDSLATEVSYE